MILLTGREDIIRGLVLKRERRETLSERSGGNCAQLALPGRGGSEVGQERRGTDLGEGEAKKHRRGRRDRAGTVHLNLPSGDKRGLNSRRSEVREKIRRRWRADRLVRTCSKEKRRPLKGFRAPSPHGRYRRNEERYQNVSESRGGRGPVARLLGKHQVGENR